jgi:hypothetical protein
LLALRPDFADLEQAFWQVFARRLGCENPAETIKQERARLSNVLYLATMAGIVALTLFLVIQAHDNTPVTAVIVGAIALVGIATMIGTPLARIARARKVAAVLARQQEPIFLTGGSIGLSSRGTVWPEGAKWWREDRIALVFVRHIAVRLGFDALSLEPIWEDPLVLATNTELPATQAAEILRHVIGTTPRYRGLVNSFHSLAALDTDYTELLSLKAESRTRRWTKLGAKDSP